MDIYPKIKYPIGIQTFSEIRKGGYLYVDKTRLIYKLVHDKKYIFLSRPRRFGKSLLLSTLQSYFAGEKDLFYDLAIERLEQDWERYPVLRFDFSGEGYLNPEHLVSLIGVDLNMYESQYGIPPSEIPESAIGSRLLSLIRKIYQSTGKQVVILIDEYDKPMLDTLLDEQTHETIKESLRGFYSVLKRCDEYIRFAMLTGVTKFGKVSIFSGMNNLKDISMIPDYNDICGITEQEFHDNFGLPISIFADVNSISEEEAWQQFKFYYDGYHFSSPANDIYNPFSTLNAFDENRLRNFWFATGSSSYLIGLIRRNHFFLQEIEGQRRNEDQLSDITGNTDDIIPLLYQAGYLTIKGCSSGFDRIYTLGLPNEEVARSFWNSLGNYFFREGRNMTRFDLNKFVIELEKGEAENFMQRLKSMFASISNEHEPDKEVHFQNMITIFVKMLGFAVQTEVHSSRGRSDIEIKTRDYIYIIELKVDSAPGEALEQILRKGYATQYAVDPRRKILIGANFAKDSRTLTGWEIAINPQCLPTDLPDET